MPHQCTNCGCAFGDGSKEMLSGCPECGGTTFQFQPDGVDDGDVPAAEEPPDPPSGNVGGRVGRATSIVRELMSNDSASGPSDPTTPEERPARTDDGRDADVINSSDPSPSEEEEDSAQATARSEFVSPDSLPAHTRTDLPPSDSSPSSSDRPSPTGRVVREPTGEHPDLAELRSELNDQFESIKILEPGQYELNLMELYDREEYIIALQENGHYVIQMPETWLSNDE
ncbi:OapC/ArvC family zinc-ribbon domain-containing protein [Halocatena pleomorpha]|uniref:Zn-ribbon containing protein n=1 Tax=Halocatena pleomorpha TaxID=1785090 RepID=A0A3P3RJC7_9EURY|nr:Zn-ribbon containing protein [Halocatena pleomorpha]RRJ32533.1 hypothetical protein EIK79_04780 [Halocatena pleomorpha]